MVCSSSFLPSSAPPSDAECSLLVPPVTEKNPQSRQTFPHECEQGQLCREKGRAEGKKSFLFSQVHHVKVEEEVSQTEGARHTRRWFCRVAAQVPFGDQDKGPTIPTHSHCLRFSPVLRHLHFQLFIFQPRQQQSS